jgi:hypothetical protein
MLLIEDCININKKGLKMITRLEMYYDMKVVRLLAEHGVIFNDDVLRDAGKRGARAGQYLRNSMILEE